LWNKDQITWNRLSKNFKPSDFCIAFIDGLPVGCMALTDYDPDFWPEIEKGTSLFIHKLAVKRIAAGKGVSSALIEYAKKECIKRELPALRFDCNALIYKLRALYENNGFVCVQERMLFGKYETAFYMYKVHDTEHLYHYYEKGLPPFLVLTSMPYDKAKQLLVSLNSRLPDIDFFLTRRYEMEKTVRDAFTARGGKVMRTAPVYMTFGPNEGMKTWFHEPAYIKIPVNEFDLKTVSFTYGDSFPVFKSSLNTGEEWWGKVYFYNEMLELYKKYGLPEDPEYHMSNGIYPKGKSIRDYLKYIEAQVWSDETLNKYRNANLN
jgi:GNAT superfamily N-acetyltransferase